VRRWDCNTNTEIEDPRIDAFLADLVAVCRKHDLSIGHEDEHGAFVVRLNFDEDDATWLRAAMIRRTP
jgi:hypothetical protein